MEMNQKNSILYLDRNENLYGPAPKCFEALKGLGVNDLSVYSRDYARGVKSKLSERLAAELGIPEPQLLLSEGSEDMLKQAVHCYLGPDKKILCPKQSWWYYQKVASEMGAQTVNYGLKEEKNSYTYDVGEIIGLYRRESPDLVLVASPNNPTGNSLSAAGVGELMEAVRDSVVILDEAYWGFDGQDNAMIPRLVDRYSNLLILRTFSKFYALAGIRIGFAAAGSGLGKLTAFASRYLGYNRISEVLAIAALDSLEYYRALAVRIKADRRRYHEFFFQQNGFRSFQSDANFVLVKIPQDSKALLQDFLKQNHVAVKFFDDPDFSSHIRITIGTTEQNDRLLSILSEFQKMRARPKVPV